MIIDLHVHSNASDGTLSPSEVVIHAKEKGLSAISLTDHDTVKGLDEATEAGALYQVEIIPGIELSADFPNDNLHILGYYINFKDPVFQKKLQPIQDGRKIRNATMTENLNKLGFEISIEEGSTIITRAHYAKALYEGGYVSSLDEAFKLYLTPGKPGYVKRITPNPKECIDIIHSGGGVAFLAHPTLYGLKAPELTKLIQQLAKDGLDGIEVMHSRHSHQDEVFLRDLATKNNLIISGGSDFHGSNKPNLEIATGYGNLKIPYSILENIKNKAEEQNG
ncbi:MAG TPA: PHP domain-containing protein [Epulopiscium sp.]|nr:PHP domain-containing protein [Candidatus Epulonipiscium sp.]